MAGSYVTLAEEDRRAEILLAEPIAWADTDTDTVAIERRRCRGPRVADRARRVIHPARRPVR